MRNSWPERVLQAFRTAAYSYPNEKYGLAETALDAQTHMRAPRCFGLRAVFNKFIGCAIENTDTPTSRGYCPAEVDRAVLRPRLAFSLTPCAPQRHFQSFVYTRARLQISGAGKVPRGSSAGVNQCSTCHR